MTNETKQTAVEWYANQLHKVFNNTTDASKFSHEELLEQAKEMEKEQMIDFSQEVFRNRYNQITQSLGNIADDIYNETYGGKK